MPATMNATVTDGPERSAMAAAVRTNRPAPMIAPMPRATSDIGPSVRFNVVSPLAAASDSRRSIDLVRNSEFTYPPDEGCDIIRVRVRGSAFGVHWLNLEPGTTNREPGTENVESRTPKPERVARSPQRP